MRFFGAAGFGFPIVATAHAGQIQIGGASGPTSSCITSHGGFMEQNYDNTLFAAEAPSAVPFGGYATTGTTASGKTLTDPNADGGNGVAFAMIAGDSASGSTANFREGASGSTGPFGQNEITIPVGVCGVTDVWTMLKLIAGTTRDANIYFNFGR